MSARPAARMALMKQLKQLMMLRKKSSQNRNKDRAREEKQRIRKELNFFLIVCFQRLQNLHPSEPVPPGIKYSVHQRYLVFFNINCQTIAAFCLSVLLYMYTCTLEITECTFQ